MFGLSSAVRQRVPRELCKDHTSNSIPGFFLSIIIIKPLNEILIRYRVLSTVQHIEFHRFCFVVPCMEPDGMIPLLSGPSLKEVETMDLSIDRL